MTDIINHIETNKGKGTQFNCKATDGLNELVDLVHEYRKSKGLDTFKSDTIRNLIIAGLHLDNPEKYLPQFDMPPDLVNKLKESQKEQTETSIQKLTDKPETNGSGTTEN